MALVLTPAAQATWDAICYSPKMTVPCETPSRYEVGPLGTKSHQLCSYCNATGRVALLLEPCQQYHSVTETTPTATSIRTAHCVEVGCSGLAPKPFVMEELLAALGIIGIRMCLMWAFRVEKGVWVPAWGKEEPFRMAEDVSAEASIAAFLSATCKALEAEDGN